MNTKNTGHKRKNRTFVSVILRIAGILFIAAVILSAAMMTVPELAGYSIYNVETGSMSPEIPVYSVIYVKAAVPEDIEIGDIITYSSAGGIITHRVVNNRRVEGELITKGDANEKEDMEPVPYSDVIGRVAFHFPELGRLLIVYSTAIGKIYVLLFAACGVMMLILAGRIR